MIKIYINPCIIGTLRKIAFKKYLIVLISICSKHLIIFQQYENFNLRQIFSIFNHFEQYLFLINTKYNKKFTNRHSKNL